MDRSRIDDLLRSFLRTDLDGTVLAGVGELSGGEWDDLLHTAARNGVAPLLYHRLTASPAGAPVPAEVIRSLRGSYLQSAARNMRLYHELGKVLGRLRQDGIPVIALKGAHLAEAIYGNIALRPMSDADLLVRAEDLGRAEEILLGLGYLPAECNRRVANDNCHFAYASADKGPVVEVHWRFLPSSRGFRIDTDGVWERSGRPVAVSLPACFEASVLRHGTETAVRHIHGNPSLREGDGLEAGSVSG